MNQILDRVVLLDQVLPEIRSLNFDRIKNKLLHKEEGNGWSQMLVDLAEEEYRRYLTLIKLHAPKAVVPSKLMDEFWHQHILDTRAYREDCDTVFGRFIDHFPYFGIYGEDDRQALINAFEQTKRWYKARFGVAMPDAEASRCEDHPCHVPSECRCRAPGTCK